MLRTPRVLIMRSGSYSRPTWHDQHTKVWAQIVKPLLPKSGVRWLEVGSFEGRSARWTIDNLLGDGGQITCVDVWRQADIEKNFDANTGGEVNKVKSRSDQFLRYDNSLYDGIYIDGSHDAPDVISDAVLSWPLLKVGGVVILDDARWHHPNSIAGAIDPAVAIKAFIDCFQTRLVVLHNGSQVIARKRRN